MTTTESWSASFAAATVDAMSAYDAVVPFMFAPWADALLDEVGVADGNRVLDVATGPGTVARLAAVRVGVTGSVVACDLSPTMLAVARSKAGPPITYLECPADALAVADEAFDIVTCQQGLQFFADRPAALTEMRRALTPGGRIAASVWCAIEQCPPFDALSIALGQVLGADAQAAYRRGPWGLSDAPELRRLFDDAGFVEVRAERRTRPIVFAGGVAQLVATLPTASIASQVAALDVVGHNRLLAAVSEALAPLLIDGAVHSELAAHVVLGAAVMPNPFEVRFQGDDPRGRSRRRRRRGLGIAVPGPIAPSTATKPTSPATKAE